MLGYCRLWSRKAHSKITLKFPKSHSQCSKFWNFKLSNSEVKRKYNLYVEFFQRWVKAFLVFFFFLGRWRNIVLIGHGESILCLVENIQDLLKDSLNTAVGEVYLLNLFHQVSTHPLVLLAQDLHISELGWTKQNIIENLQWWRNSPK